MDREDSYTTTVRSILNVVVPLNEKFEKENPTHPIKTVPISSPDYRAMEWKPKSSIQWTFCNDRGRSSCPRCNGINVNCLSLSAGCRMSGDGYGTDFAYCGDCGLLDYTSYDQA
eukprot:PhF_6_TR23956/c0_g1_i2/m.33530